MIGRESVVITVQNGVEVVDTISRQIGREHVAGGAAYIMAAVEAPAGSGTRRPTTWCSASSTDHAHSGFRHSRPPAGAPPFARR